MGGKVKAFLVNSAIKVMSILPLRNAVVFESSPDFACNAYPVYEKLRSDSEFFSKYKLMWLVTDGKEPCQGVEKNQLIYDDPKSFSKIIKNLYYRSTAKCFVMSNRVKNKVRKGQFFIFLCHGSKTKKTRDLYEIGDAVDCVLCQSHFFDDVICEEYNINKEQLVYLGYPRCDALFEYHTDVKEKFGAAKGEKLILWLPTYRKHKNVSDEEAISTGIPLLRDSECAEKFGKALTDCKVRVILKPHPAEDITNLKAFSVPNFTVITDEMLEEKGVKLYELLSASDALISDYSSVFYDWLLCDRPMGLTADDEQAYKNSRGFAFDLDPLYDKASERLKSVSDLCDFVKDVAEGKDRHLEGRREVRDLTNIYKDGNSAERTASFIVNKLKG